MFDSRWFAKVKVTKVWKQKQGEMTNEEARGDGHADLEEFQAAWTKIYGRWNPQEEMTVIEFQVLEVNPQWRSLLPGSFKEPG